MHIQKHLIDRAKHTELNEIYWAVSLKTFAISFVMIFIPIYLYNLGYTFLQIFLFFAALYFFIAITNELSARVIIKIGPKHTMALSFPLLVFFLWLLLTLPYYKWNLFLLAFVWGFEMAFFWMSYHIDFSKAKHKKTCASELSRIEVLCTIFGAIAPFIGGFIASRFDISFTFLISIIFIVLASLPLFKTGEPHIKNYIDMKKIQPKKIYKDLISYIGMGIDFSAMTVIWPLFVFLLVKTYELVGAIESIALLLMVFITLIVGKLADHEDKQKLLKRGGFVNGSIWLVKAFSQTGLQVLMFNILNAITFPFLKLPFFSEFYLHADEEARIEYILWMERAVNLGRSVLFLFLAFLSLYFDIKIVLIISFILAALGAFMTSLMRPVVTETDKLCADSK